MTDRPIIFSAPMVRALLEGRKTMTRRILKPQPEICFDSDGKQLPIGMMHVEGDPLPRVTVGRVITRQQIRFMPGDRLWVRENFMPRPNMERAARPHYRADPESDRPEWRGLWRPSIHMPRWASRLTLIVTAVKVERLQAITEEDARAEGIYQRRPEELWSAGGVTAGACPRSGFMMLWKELHGMDAWDANPYVVAISFSVQKQNIDTLPKAEAA